MKPFSRLKSVVLPAPFGPMMPRTSPRRTSKLTSCDRLEAAEARATGCAPRGPVARRRSPVAPARRLTREREQPAAARPRVSCRRASASRRRQYDALGREQDHGDDRGAEHDALDARESCRRARRAGSRRAGSGSPSRSPGPTPSPTPPNSVTISACAEVSMPNTVARRDDEQDHGIEAAGRGRDGAGHHDRLQLPAQRVDAGGLRRPSRSA